MIATDEELASKMKVIANHGQKEKYYHERVGVNSRLDTLQAAVLLVKLQYLKEYESRRSQVCDFYDKELKNISGLQLPVRFAKSTHVFHQYTLKAERRDELKSFLETKDIPTMIYYPVPLHFQKAYQQSTISEGSFPVSERLAKEVISLPIHTEMKESELDYICSSIKDFYHG